VTRYPHRPAGDAAGEETLPSYFGDLINREGRVEVERKATHDILRWLTAQGLTNYELVESDQVDVGLVSYPKSSRSIEALTWRWGQHSMRANLPDPRTDREMDDWKARDPIARLRSMLSEREIVATGELDGIDARAKRELDEAVAFAESSPEPGEDLLETAVYAPHARFAEPAERGSRELTFVQALNEAMAQEMERDPAVFLMGEDVGATGGIFQVSKGLMDRFGAERVRDTPISEATFCGAGVGAAIAGMRPIVEVQIFDFVTLMMDMIVNQAAKFRFMLGGGPKVPLVIRGPQGGGIRLAAQHSQSLEAWFTHVPGLTVVAPSTPYDAKGLLAAAIRHDGPVIFLEHKLLYVGQPGPVPEEPYVLPIGKADVKREGRDATVVATMSMVERALGAARVLARQGIEVEVIDPRTLHPLDEATIVESVRKTNRLVVVHEAPKRGGFGAEVASVVLEHAFDHLDAPIVRLGAPHVPMPYNDKLERAVIPSQEDIVAAVLSVCYRDQAAGSA
jgi:2-oxoisovalerate dehydrogenase E1 component